MDAAVVYESLWGNTRSIAEAVARGLGPDAALVDVGADSSTLDRSVELVVVGGPTHAFSMTRPSTRRDAVARGAPTAVGEARGIREWLAQQQPSSTRRVATFDTRVAKGGRLPGSAAKAAARVVRRRRLGRLVASVTFCVRDVTGPLADGEVERAERWGHELRSLGSGASVGA